MSRRAAGIVGALVLVLCLALGGWLTHRPAALPVAAAHEPAAGAPHAPGGAAAPSAPPPFAPPDPDSAAAAHERIAQALGLVSIRCWVGPEQDSDDLVGAYHQRVEGGWYSDVVSTLSGAQAVERRFVAEPGSPGDADFETVFFVRWEAEAPGTTVPCTVDFPRYAELTVRVVDGEGAPLQGANVFGCGTGGTSDAAGRVEVQAFAGGVCELRAFARRPIASGRLEVEPLEEHEQRTVVLVVEPGLGTMGGADEDEEVEDEDEPVVLATPEDPAGYRAEAAVFRRLREGAPARQAALFDALVKHREWLADETEARDRER